MTVLARAGAASVVTAMLLTAGCTAAPGDDADALRVRSCETQSPLIPAAALDECARNVLEPVTATLMTAGPDGRVEPDLAEEITSTDGGETWTVTLVEGRRFSDGTPVLAHNFVDAWNWSASCRQGYPGADWFADIEGYTEVNPSGACPQAAASVSPSSSPVPSADPADQRLQMSGLEVTSDLTFRVRLGRPIVDFDEQLVELAYAPLPDSFWVDPARYAQVPVGAGPYRLVENNRLRHVVQRWDGYTGPKESASRTISFENWNDLSLAYEDVRDGELDVSDRVPPESFGEQTWRSDFGERAAAPDGAPPMVLAELVFSDADEMFADPRRRRALSMAIDREVITRDLLGGMHDPARGWVPPTMTGAVETCADDCVYDRERARRLWDDANDSLGSTPTSITVTTASELGDSYWVDELCNTWRYTLDLTCQRREVSQSELGSGKTGVFTEGVALMVREPARDSMQEYLEPFQSESPLNRGRHASMDFDAVMRRADATENPGDEWESAQRMLAEDLPSLPLWWMRSTAIWSPRVDVAPEDLPTTFAGTPDVLRLRRA